NFSFRNTSSADHGVFTIHGSGGHAYPSQISFVDSSPAGSATINIRPSGFLEMSSISPNLTSLGNATVINSGGYMQIGSQSSCGSATIVNARVTSDLSSVLNLFDNATAGSANITNEGADTTSLPGVITIVGTATANQAVITNDGGDGVGKAGSSMTFGNYTTDTPSAGAATLIANAGSNG